MAEQVRIKVIIDPSGAKKGSKQTKEYLLDIGEAADKTEKQTKQLGLGTVSAGNLMAMAYAEVSQRALQVLKQTRELAFSVEETGSKFDTVLGDNVAKANKFLEENAGLLGVTTTEGKEFVSTSVQIAKGLGMNAAAATDFGLEWTKLAGDFQSFFNVPFEEGFGAIRSGLVGETEPLKRFGIVIREAEVSERALMETGKQRKDELTEEERVQARYNLIVEQAGVVVGDLERTQQSAANQTRRMNAAYREIAEQLASKTLPIWNSVAGTGLQVAESIMAMIEPVNQISAGYRKATRDLANFEENVIPMLDEYEELTSKTNLTNAEQERLNTVIQDLARNVPASVKEFDEYGDVIGINTEKTRAYLEQMRKLEKLKNAEEIERISEALKEYSVLAENTSKTIQNWDTETEELNKALSAQSMGFGSGLESLEDFIAANESLKDQMRVTLGDLLELGYSAEEIEEKFPYATKAVSKFWEALTGQGLENIDARLDDIITTAKPAGASDKEEEVSELKKLKQGLDDLLSVQDKWTEAQAQEAIRIDQKIKKIEAEGKARENLLEVMSQPLPQRGDPPISRSTRDVAGETIGSTPEARSFSTTDTDSRSIQQLQEERTELEKQFTETTNSEERKRLLGKLQTNQEYMTAAEQGITREEMLRQQSQQRAVEQFQQYVQTISQGYSQIVQIQGQATQARIDKINQEKQAALGAIDARLQNDKLSERQREQLVAKREKTETEYQEKVDALKHKQFERERKAKLAEIAMNTAIAISKFWATQGPLAIITQALAVGMGIAQAAIVAKQPNPYLQGGLVEERMRSGKTSPGKKLISVNENDKPEFIMNAVSTARSLPVLNRMNRDPEYAAMINRQMQNRSPVGGRRQGIAAQSSDLTNIGPMVSAAVREGLEGANVSSHINWSDFHHGYERWKNNQKSIGN